MSHLHTLLFVSPVMGGMVGLGFWRLYYPFKVHSNTRVFSPGSLVTPGGFSLIRLLVLESECETETVMLKRNLFHTT